MSLPRGTGPGLFEKFAGRGWAKKMVRSMGNLWANHGKIMESLFYLDFNFLFFSL